MSYEVLVSTALPRQLAAVRRTVKASEIPSVIQGALGEVWSFLGEHRIRSSGHNVALYGPADGGSGPDTLVDAWFGVEVHETIPASDRILTTATPAGLVASAVHWGEYSSLGDAHAAVRAWCQANGRGFSGVAWEVYGDWFDDWSMVRTDVIYQLDE